MGNVVALAVVLPNHNVAQHQMHNTHGCNRYAVFLTRHIHVVVQRDGEGTVVTPLLFKHDDGVDIELVHDELTGTVC